MVASLGYDNIHTKKLGYDNQAINICNKYLIDEMTLKHTQGHVILQNHKINNKLKYQNEKFNNHINEYKIYKLKF